MTDLRPTGIRPTDAAGESPSVTPTRPARPAAVLMALLGVALAVIVAVAAGSWAARTSIERDTVVLAVGVAAGIGLALLAATRFAAFIVVLVAIRASLDGLKLSGFGDSAITEPGVLVGAVLLMACILWLLAQRAASSLVPLSTSARWLLVFAATALASVLGSGDAAASGQAAVRVLASVLTFVVVEQLLARRPRRVYGLLAAGALSLVVPAAVAVGQLATSDELYTFSTVARVQGSFVHPNSFAAYLVVVAVTALAVALSTSTSASTSASVVRRVAVVVGVVACVLTLFTYARGAWIALGIGVAYLLVKRRRALVVWLVAGAAALVVLVPSVGSRLGDLSSSPSPTEIGDGTANSLEWRFQYWEEILPLWQQNPVTGIGLDQVPERTPAMAEPHSVFVQAVVETGLLGIAALVGVVVAIWRDLAAARRRAGTGIDRWMALGATAVAAGMFVQMFTENLLTQVAIHLYLWIPVAYATSMLRRPPGSAPPDAHGATPATGIGGSEPASTASDDPSVVDGAA